MGQFLVFRAGGVCGESYPIRGATTSPRAVTSIGNLAAVWLEHETEWVCSRVGHGAPSSTGSGPTVYLVWYISNRFIFGQAR
jgi:hypothetical protein